MNMTDRQSQFLKEIIDNYVVTAEPVASGLLAGKADVSSATVRNDMADLERGGYIAQPYTSAGRVPTLKGYRYYLDNFFQAKKPPRALQEKLANAAAGSNAVKELSKETAEAACLAVLVAFERNNFFYTGLSQLFSQPEFEEQKQVVSITSVLDAFDDVMLELHESAGDALKIVIGNDNPFSPATALLVSKISVAEGHKGVMAMLGPLRMNYNANAGMLNYIKQSLDKKYVK